MKFLIWAALMVGVAGGGCKGEDCDPGQTLMNHLCADPRPTPPASPPPAAAPSDGGATMCEAGDGFGAKCKTSADCPCGLDYCNTYMNMNICTKTGCKQNPGVCPPGFQCMDLSVYSPTLPSLCYKP